MCNITALNIFIHLHLKYNRLWSLCVGVCFFLFWSQKFSMCSAAENRPDFSQQTHLHTCNIVLHLQWSNQQSQYYQYSHHWKLWWGMKRTFPVTVTVDKDTDLSAKKDITHLMIFILTSSCNSLSFKIWGFYGKYYLLSKKVNLT